MIEVIKKHGPINAFLLVFNGSVARWNGSTLAVLDILGKNFPRFWENVIVIFNFMPQDAKAIKRRQATRPDSKLVAEAQNYLRETYKTDALLPTICLDAKYLPDEPEEVQAFQMAMEQIFLKAKFFNPYDPSLAAAHKSKLDEAEEQKAKLSRELNELQIYLADLESRFIKAEAEGNAKESARLAKEYQEKVDAMNSEQRENLKRVQEAMEEKRAASEAVFRAQIEKA